MFKGFYFILLVVLSLNSDLVQAQSSCRSAKNCDECMRAGPECYWCEDQNFIVSGQVVRRSRCDVKAALAKTCSVLRYLNSSTTVLEDKEMGSIVQVRPQKFKLSLRPGQTESFKITVKPAEDFPVDIYFLMDLSASMKAHLDNLRKLAGDIADAIGTITKNYRLGFGAFIDKPIQPYVFYSDRDWSYFPCSDVEYNSGKCALRPVFGFAHFFDFDSNTTLFSAAVGSITLSGDTDDAEGCFDGLMQVVACEEEIKWKPKDTARRLVIIATDAEPKLAGDGRMANIVQPSDGKCYLKERKFKNNTELFYYRAKDLDYPSISQLRHLMKLKDVAPIFAVDKTFESLYKTIAEEWADLGSAVGVLEKNSTDIVSLVRDNYNRIATTISLTDEAPPYLELIYQVNETTCTTPANVVSNSICAGVKLSHSVEFDVKARLKYCPNPLPKDPSVNVRIAGFGLVTIDLEYLCQCNCDVEPKSPKCNNVGTYICGVCECEAGHYGDNCQCDASQISPDDNSKCLDSVNNKTVCNGQGRCICGECECFILESPKLVSGGLCECINYGCLEYNGTECGGESRGVCECGNCKCNPKYTGLNCGQLNCTVHESLTCKQNDIECNGHGKCENCADCRCDPGFAGLYCDQCITQDCKCDVIDTSCLACHLNNVTCSEEKNCSMHEFIPVANVTFDAFCTVQFGQCVARYNYSGVNIHNTTMVWTYLENFVCVQSVTDDDDTETMAIIIGVIAGILLLGLLLLLLWKLLVTLHDKNEYAKFQKSAEESQFDKKGNPIYREPNQQFVNPAYSAR